MGESEEGKRNGNGSYLRFLVVVGPLLPHAIPGDEIAKRKQALPAAARGAWLLLRVREALTMRSARCSHGHSVLLCGRLTRISSVWPRLPPHPPAIGRAFSSSARQESLDEEMVRLAKYRQTSVSLKATLDTGLGLLLPQKECAMGLTSRQRTLIQISSFLKRELPVRLARRVLELKSGPEGLGEMPAVNRVREWYEQSFVDIRRARDPVDLETEDEFHRLLGKVAARRRSPLVLGQP